VLPWRLPVVTLDAVVTPPATSPVAPAPEPSVISAPQDPARDPGIASGVDRSVTPLDRPQGGGARTAISPATLVTLLLVIWGLGALYLVVRLVLGAVVLGRVVRRGTPLETPDWRRPLLEAADRLALPDLPRLVMSDRFPMPFACGLARPAIVLPSGAAEWDDRRRRTVLVHELAHVSRRDLVANAVGQLACALYWFHPLVWIAARKLRIESERPATIWCWGRDASFRVRRSPAADRLPCLALTHAGGGVADGTTSRVRGPHARDPRAGRPA
jgi:beta-lactamase regulating signal transducer with metallopeptidase domain